MRPHIVLVPLLLMISLFNLVIQVSPNLYGDNNTRLFTYWTVSPINKYKHTL